MSLHLLPTAMLGILGGHGDTRQCGALRHE